MRFLILAHRYTGIAIGFVVAAWCMSGFVMLYVQYPEFTDSERVVGLDVLDLSGCCAARSRPGTAAVSAALASEGLRRVRVEMLAGQPVLRTFHGSGQIVVDLTNGRVRPGLDASDATDISRAFQARMGLSGQVDSLGSITRDQWTVYDFYRPHRPLHHFALDDAARTEWYVSGTTGEVLQITTGRERFWNWLGSVPHWIYFTALREHTFAWSQTVLGLTFVSLFLTAIGMYIGIARLGAGRRGSASPYRGWMLWHHYTGLAFGALVLTWLLSGFLSLNPWGALEGRSFAGERARLRQGDLPAEHVSAMIAGLASATLPSGTVRLDSSLVLGELSFIAWNGHGERRRLDAKTLRAAPATGQSMADAAAALRPQATIRDEGWLNDDDAYYFSHHTGVEFPVYRIQYEDGERFYLDAVTGELVHGVDTARQRYRWLFEAVHRGDFFRLLRTRPVWDFVMLPLLIGVTVSALTGTWLGFKRVTGWRLGRRRN